MYSGHTLANFLPDTHSFVYFTFYFIYFSAFTHSLLLRYRGFQMFSPNCPRIIWLYDINCIFTYSTCMHQNQQQQNWKQNVRGHITHIVIYFFKKACLRAKKKKCNELADTWHLGGCPNFTFSLYWRNIVVAFASFNRKALCAHTALVMWSSLIQSARCDNKQRAFCDYVNLCNNEVNLWKYMCTQKKTTDYFTMLNGT